MEDEQIIDISNGISDELYHQVLKEQKIGRTNYDPAKTEERREYVWGLMKQRGVHNFPLNEVASIFECSVATVRKDIDINLDKMPLPVVEREAKSLLLAFNRAISQAFKLIETNIPQKMEVPVRLQGEDDVSYQKRYIRAERNFKEEKEFAMKRVSDGVQKLILAGQSYTVFLENFGFKEKIASKVEIKTVSMQRIDHVLRRAENAGRRIFTSEDVTVEQE